MLNERIKEERIKKGLSQKELGDLFGITQQAVGSWEIGKSIPDAITLLKLADFFNTSTDSLLGRNKLNKNTFSATQEEGQKNTTGHIPVVNGIMKMDDIIKAKEQTNLDKLNDLKPDEMDLIIKYRQMKDAHKNMMHTVADNVIPAKDENAAAIEGK